MPVQLDEYKTRQRAVWETGEYSTLSPYIADVGELVVARARIEPGMSVLDVACGTGNAARPARIEWDSIEAWADFFMARASGRW